MVLTSHVESLLQGFLKEFFKEFFKERRMKEPLDNH